MRYVFVINPISGKRDIQEMLVPKIHEYFRDKALDYIIELTERPKHATEIVKKHAESMEKIRVCACGGDGTLNEVAAGAYSYENVEIACYPCGSGNDFIKSLGGEADDYRDISVMVTGKSIPVDIMTVNDRFCINIMSVGIDADISEAVIKYRKAKFLRGPMAYNLALLECILKPLGKNFKIKIDDKLELNDKYLLAVAGNGRVYGGGYNAVPQAQIDDGKMDIVLVENMKLSRITNVIPVYKRGEHLVDGRIVEELADKLSFCRAGKMEISSEEEFIVNIDGERFHTKYVKAGMIKKALRFVVPAAGDKQ